MNPAIGFVLLNKSVRATFHSIGEGTDIGPGPNKLFTIESEIVKVLSAYALEVGHAESQILSRALEAMFPTLKRTWPSFGLADGETYYLNGQSFIAVISDEKPAILLDAARSSVVENQFRITDSVTFLQGRKSARMTHFRYAGMAVSPDGHLYRFNAQLDSRGRIEGGVMLDSMSRNASDLLTEEQFAAQNEPEPA